ncbi:hypothetical protein [Raineya orbicola]|jgi:hypothetical protein|uniref:Uncharacterized protein n=1 Tax=Raineya orbicola TaxID=2016530 RepID=A0A2N3IF98_9BACT|nr:hypothetical protein [Raineya orbicola]PKQ68965.1 hypothetical protein Rain11_1498 [Raineya orbicola]
MKKLICVFLFWVSVNIAYAQCVMCKSVSEQGNTGGAINSAILYMAFFPYLLIVVIGYLWYKNYKRQRNARKNQTSSDFGV